MPSSFAQEAQLAELNASQHAAIGSLIAGEHQAVPRSADRYSASALGFGLTLVILRHHEFSRGRPGFRPYTTAIMDADGDVLLTQEFDQHPLAGAPTTGMPV